MLLVIIEGKLDSIIKLTNNAITSTINDDIIRTEVSSLAVDIIYDIDITNQIV